MATSLSLAHEAGVPGLGIRDLQVANQSSIGAENAREFMIRLGVKPSADNRLEVNVQDAAVDLSLISQAVSAQT